MFPEAEDQRQPPAGLPSKTVGSLGRAGQLRATGVGRAPIGGRSAINGSISESRIGGSHVRCTDIFPGAAGIGSWLFRARLGAVDLHGAPDERIAKGVFQLHSHPGGLGLVRRKKQWEEERKVCCPGPSSHHRHPPH